MEREERARVTDDVRRDDERDAGRYARRAARETGRDIRDAGADVFTSTCGILGNLLIGVGEALSPRTRARSRYVQDAEAAEAAESPGPVNCLDFSGGIGNLVSASARVCAQSPCAGQDEYEDEPQRPARG